MASSPALPRRSRWRAACGRSPAWGCAVCRSRATRVERFAGEIFDDFCERSARTMAAIDLKDLTKVFGSVTAVNALTLSIPDKEFVALLGPSGCGKTTTMNMIAGIEHSTS